MTTLAPAPAPPADLAAFWQSSLERSSAAPLEAAVEPVPIKGPHRVFKVTYRGFDGVPIRAYLGLPIDTVRGSRKPRPLPALVGGPGYGGWEFGTTLSECQRGFALLHVFPRGQGESGELWQVEKGAEKAWVNHGMNDPKGFYYQGAYLDLVRGVDFLVSRPDIDPAAISAVGTSQGGLLALGLAGVDQRIRSVVAHLPYLCAVRQNQLGLGGLTSNQRFLQTWDYFDPLHLAPSIAGPCLLSAGGKDLVCPANTIRAVFDQLPGIKSLACYPDLTHTSCTDFYEMTWQWLERYAR